MNTQAYTLTYALYFILTICDFPPSYLCSPYAFSSFLEESTW